MYQGAATLTPAPAPPGGGPPIPAPAPSGAGGKAPAQVHPEFLALMAPVLKRHNGRVSISDALAKIGKSFDDLPKLQAYTSDKGVSRICWNHLLGICNRGSKCNFKRGHLQPSALPPEFVASAKAVLGPAMQRQMQEPPRQRQKTG